MADGDMADLIRAVADDLLAAFPPEDGEVEPESIYDWMLQKAKEVGTNG